MSDPRLNGDHLNLARRDRYDAAVGELLDSRGSVTSAADPLVRPSSLPRQSARQEHPPPGGIYYLVCGPDGPRYRLRVGINSIGRYPENDLVFEENCISRRHCVLLVHATGGCEVSDTASRNGTRVNGRRVARTDLCPGDELRLCDRRFVVVWVGPNGEVLPTVETSVVGELSPTG